MKAKKGRPQRQEALMSNKNVPEKGYARRNEVKSYFFLLLISSFLFLIVFPENISYTLQCVSRPSNGFEHPEGNTKLGASLSKKQCLGKTRMLDGPKAR
jgi:hypothetical protein